MTFTNDDLKRLKEIMDRFIDLPYDKSGFIINAQDLIALIARLEAAEKVCEYLHICASREGYPDRDDEFEELKEAWYKVAGK